MPSHRLQVSAAGQPPASHSCCEANAAEAIPHETAPFSLQRSSFCGRGRTYCQCGTALLRCEDTFGISKIDLEHVLRRRILIETMGDQRCMGMSEGFGSTHSGVGAFDPRLLAKIRLRLADPVGGGTNQAPQVVRIPHPHPKRRVAGKAPRIRAQKFVAPADTGIGKHKEARPLTATTRAKQLRSPSSPNSTSAAGMSCRWEASQASV